MPSIKKSVCEECRNCELYKHEFKKAKNNKLRKLNKQLNKKIYDFEMFKKSSLKLFKPEEEVKYQHNFLNSIEEYKNKKTNIKNSSVGEISIYPGITEEMIREINITFPGCCRYCECFTKNKPRKNSTKNLVILSYEYKLLEIQKNAELTSKFPRIKLEYYDKLLKEKKAEIESYKQNKSKKIEKYY